MQQLAAAAALAAACAIAMPDVARAQIPDRISLVRLRVGAGGHPGASTSSVSDGSGRGRGGSAAPRRRLPPPAAADFVDVFQPGLAGIRQFRWPHLAVLPNGTVLALASACNASVICSSSLPHTPCCLDTDEQMPVLRRSTDGGRTFGEY